MKELKFRVWDKDEKKMIYFDLLELSDWGFDKIQSYFHPFNEMQVMLCTGLKAKGKDIYFSDVISTNSGRPSEVKDDYEFLAWLEKHQDESEIIGNVHENLQSL